MKQFILTLCILATATFGLTAQISTPAASPTATLKQEVGLTDVEVTYSRPSMRGRTIFSTDGLVPFGQIWRLGANYATKFTFSDDVTMGGQPLKAGSYAALATPAKGEWKIMLYPYVKGNWSSYKDQSPAAIIAAKTMNTANAVESFTIDFGGFADDGATIMFSWENTVASVALKVDSDTKVMKAIDKALAGTSAGEYYAAGSYYHKSGKDINKAYEWVHKANEMSPRFWQLRREALILADMDRMGDAIKMAQKSTELAKKAENAEYVKMNEASIAEWTAKAKKKGVKSSKKSERM